jgi:hypothetical protein
MINHMKAINARHVTSLDRLRTTNMESLFIMLPTYQKKSKCQSKSVCRFPISWETIYMKFKGMIYWCTKTGNYNSTKRRVFYIYKLVLKNTIMCKR